MILIIITGFATQKIIVVVLIKISYVYVSPPILSAFELLVLINVLINRM